MPTEPPLHSRVLTAKGPAFCARRPLVAPHRQRITKSAIDMDETQARAEVHRTIIERYPMYHEDPAFEAWMFDRTGSDAGKIAEVLDALAAYGYLDGEGMVTGNYAAMPDPSAMTDEMRGRLDAIDGRTRELLRIASVEGPTFSAEVLAHIDGATVALHDAGLDCEGDRLRRRAARRWGGDVHLLVGALPISSADRARHALPRAPGRSARRASSASDRVPQRRARADDRARRP